MLTLALLAVCLTAGAQEAGDANSEKNNSQRPPETELLLESPSNSPSGGEAEPIDNGRTELPGIGFGDFAKMILVLGLVIALIYGFFWMLKRFAGVKAEREDAIRLLSTRPLKGDAALHLVEVGSRIFLVGSGGNTVNLVSEIDDKESVDAVRLAISRAPGPVQGGFARLFKDKFGIGPSPSGFEENGSSVSEESAEDPASYLKRQRERLKDL